MDYITAKEYYDENKEKFHLKIIAGEQYLGKKKIVVSDINRPGLALASYFGYFPFERVQVFGKTELSFIKKMGVEKANKMIDKILKKNIPCIIVSRNQKLPFSFIAIANKYKMPIFETSLFTTKIISATMLYLERKLAPKMTMHGTFMSVYGVGVMLIGKSGIGKSEIALELIKRGHQLVADDLIEITRLNDEQLVGRGLSVVQHHMEIRGIGIIDVKTLFGVGAIRTQQPIELLLRLEEWQKGKDYERLGIEEQKEEMLGVKVPTNVLPVRPGRNMSVICEVAAMNQRLRNQGQNPAKVLNDTILGWMEKGSENAGYK